ncbi:MAG: recombination protein RecA [Myxococcota bacterium]
MKKQTLKERAHAAAAGIARAFGDESIRVLSDKSITDIEVVSTGSIGLDRALGVGGVPRGRIVEVYGPESSGKTTLTLNIAAEAQRAGGLVAFIDVEHALDRKWAETLGVDMDGLLLSQPDSGEEALEIVDQLIRDAKVELVIVDSVAALVPRAELNGEIGDQHIGLQARLMSQALRKLAPIAHRQGTTLVFINQTRTKIGVTFGSPETTTGGKALRFYASMRLKIRRIGTLKKGDVAYGARTRVNVIKNKVASPHREAEFDLVYGFGVDREAELLDYGLAMGLCSKRGAWFSCGEERLGQGRLNAAETLRQRKDLADPLRAEILRRWRLEDGLSVEEAA